MDAALICRIPRVAAELARVRNEPDVAQLESRVQREVYSLLAQNPRREPMRMRRVGELTRLLTDETETGVLIRIKAALRAASLYCADVLRRERRFRREPIAAAEALGGGRYYVTPRNWDLFRLEIPKRLPRRNPQVAATPESLHRELDLIPEQFESWRIVPLPASDAIADPLLRARVARGAFRVAVSPMTLDADLRGRSLTGFPDDQPARFLVDSVGEEKPQLELLHRVLCECRDEGVSFLVLPELRMPPNFVATVAEFLRAQSRADLKAGKGLLLVAAGSWHVRHGDGRSWVNRCTVLNHVGRRLWEHDKLVEFEITADQVNDNLRERYGLNAHGGIEGIRAGNQLEVLETAAGRVAAAICVGYFHKPLEDLLIASRAEIFLVPTMSPLTLDLRDRARELVRSQRASTFVANCATTARRGKAETHEDARSFYQTPLAPETEWMPCPGETGKHLHIFHFQFTAS